MRENFLNSFYKTLTHEGGYVNHPNDPGGPTMLGVTLGTYREHFGTGKTIGDLKKIPAEDVQYIYRVGYWNECKCDDLPIGVDHLVFDYAVNSGPGTAIRDLQLTVHAACLLALG